MENEKWKLRMYNGVYFGVIGYVLGFRDQGTQYI